MDGFVTSHIAADVNGPEDGPYTMGYLERNDIPFHYALAGHPDYTPAAGADFVASKIDAIAAKPGRPGSSWTGCRSAAGSGAVPDRVAVDDGPLLYAAVTGGDTGIYVINTATSRVASVITDADDPQGIAISPSGSTLYVTNPDNGTLWQINAAIGHVIGTVSAGAEPQAVAVTPDGSQVWVGNGYTGSLSVISAVTNKVTTTISGGGQATALNSAITDIAFGPAS